MNLQGKFAMVTGGGSGIGLAITKALRSAGSDVLIVGRNETRLNAAQGDDSAILTVAADLADPDDRSGLIERLSSGRPLDILVNNAGSMTRIDLHDPNAHSLVEHDVALNLAAPVHLSIALLPVLRQRPEAAIVNVSTGLVYAPLAFNPGYSTAKAGLHAFTRSLRRQTRRDSIHVLEVFPPIVDTELTRGYGGPKIGPEAVGTAVVKPLASSRNELRVGRAKFLYSMSRIAPNGIFSIINRATEKRALVT
ncbi:MAG TPA: SDR family NAD(P)-dependent oxidoreductase [Mycobacterium sp.]|nr:SDR family NAD(P)-dependent oxidoreductase [Mycobacterium sp.]